MLENVFEKNLSILQSYRINIKNVGSPNNGVDVISVEDAVIEEPEWFCNELGIGKSVTGTSMHNVLIVAAKKTGTLKIWFRGIDKYSESKRFPIWIDYISIKINSKELLSAPENTWHDAPFFFSIPVTDGQKVKIEFITRLHNYSKEEIKSILLKCSPNFDCLDEFYTFYNNSKKEQQEHLWGFIKNNLLEKEPFSISVDEITENTSGRLRILIGNTKFETLLIPSKTKKMYVNLTAIGNVETEYPRFTRVSWCSKFNGNYICFDDPTRDELKIAPAFYFGNAKENYLLYLQQIIEKIAKARNISYDNITFISSSNGGFAALWLADKIPGSKAIALCPQIDVTQWGNNVFCKHLQLDEKLYKDRLQNYKILQNKNSYFFIYSNLLGWSDKVQMECLFKKAGKELKKGFFQVTSNVKCLLAEIDAPTPHLAQPDDTFVKLIEKNMSNSVSKEVIDIYDFFLDEMKDFYAQQKKELA